MYDDHDTLPLVGVLAELEGAVDREAALALAGRYGGRRVYVPETVTPQHPLARCIGESGAVWLCNTYGGRWVDVARCAHVERHLRNRRIAAARADGLTLRELGERFDLTPRQIINILASMEAAA